MPVLYILRHGEAFPHAPSDAERPLTPRGDAQAAEAAQWLAGLPLTTVLTSPYLRARQTADRVVATLGTAPTPIPVDGITPDDPPAVALQLLDKAVARGDLLVVSHLPLVGLLASQLLQGHNQAAPVFYTASMAAIEFSEFGPGLGNLIWLRHCQG